MYIQAWGDMLIILLMVYGHLGLIYNEFICSLISWPVVTNRRQIEFREVFFKRYAMITGFWKLIEYILSKSWKNFGTLTMEIDTLNLF